MLSLQHRSLTRDLEARASQRFEDSAGAVERLVEHHLALLQSRYESIAARPYVPAIVEAGHVPTIVDIAASLVEKQGAARIAFLNQNDEIIAGSGIAELDELALAQRAPRLIVFDGKPFAVVTAVVRAPTRDVGSLIAVEPLPDVELASWSTISGAQVLFESEGPGSLSRRRKVLRDLGSSKLYVEAPRTLPADEAAIASSRWNLFFAGAISLGVAFAAGIFLSRGLVRPIQELGSAAERIGTGDFTVKVKNTGTDEIGVVARAFERMTTNLRNAIVGVSGTADDVEAVAGRISTLTAGVSSATLDQARETIEASAMMDRISSQVEHVAREASNSAGVLGDSVQGSSSAARGLIAFGDSLNRNLASLCEHTDAMSTSMATSTSQVARSSEVLVENAAASTTAVKEVVRGTAEVTRFAEKSNELSNRVVEIAERGRLQVKSTTEGMDTIQGETRKVEESISRLSERMGQISSVVGLIESIADEAKLLALNGSIAAAQAGDEGRSFSVVADHMGKLASRVFSETGRIVEAVHAVEEETVDALSATGRSAKSVSVGVELAADAATALDAITEAARENSKHMDDVLSATMMQNQASEQALKQMEETRTELDQIRGAYDEQASITRNVSKNSVALGEAAEEVLQATESQARESERIVEILEAVRLEVESTSQSLLEQAATFAEAKKRLEAVKQRAGTNNESVDRVESEVRELLEQAERLRAEIQRMRC
jgi:methyl-accepting chemotaxis protein